MTSRKHTLQARVLEHCQVLKVFHPGMRTLVAVSGGADSMVLLDCLERGRKALRIEIVVAHVDHGLRKGSEEDESFVMRHAADKGLEAVSRRVATRAVASSRRLTIEEAGRMVRYDALSDMAREVGADVVSTGHTATDQAETLLMRMVRGTGPLGLTGINPFRADGLVRPLLCASRDEVRAWADNEGIPYRDDPTNNDQRFLRNRVRLQVLPLLIRMNPRVEFSLSELADSVGSLSGWIESLTTGMIRETGPHVRVIESETLESCDSALLPYVIRVAFQQATGLPLGLSRTHIESLVRLSRPAGEKKVFHLPRGVTVRRDRRGLWFEKGEVKRR